VLRGAIINAASQPTSQSVSDLVADLKEDVCIDNRMSAWYIGRSWIRSADKGMPAAARELPNRECTLIAYQSCSAGPKAS
jgi:hypothetical protein